MIVNGNFALRYYRGGDAAAEIGEHTMPFLTSALRGGGMGGLAGGRVQTVEPA